MIYLCYLCNYLFKGIVMRILYIKLYIYINVHTCNCTAPVESDCEATTKSSYSSDSHVSNVAASTPGAPAFLHQAPNQLLIRKPGLRLRAHEQPAKQRTTEAAHLPCSYKKDDGWLVWDHSWQTRSAISSKLRKWNSGERWEHCELWRDITSSSKVVQI